MSKKIKAYAALLQLALAGQFGPSIQSFYARAIKYHAAQKTVFPRKRLESVELPDDPAGWIETRKISGIPAGDHVGQRLFDQMMIEAKAK